MLFIFDQSFRHTKMREDGLFAPQMNISYGGAVVTQHTSTIQEVGTYNQSLSIGDTQEKVLVDDDEGTFWMPSEI